MIQNENDESKSRTKASFTLLSRNLDLPALLTVVGPPPDSAWQRDELISPSSNRGTRHEFSGFSISSRAKENDSIQVHLNSIFNVIQPRFNEYQSLIRDISENEPGHYSARFWVHVWKNKHSFDSEIDQTAAKFIGDLGAWLAISFRHFSDF